MVESGGVWIPSNFLALPEGRGALDSARVVVLPVPYDSTTSFKSGARDGPRAIIEASYNLEDYDPELDTDVSEVGIHTAPWLEPHMEGPRHMVDRVERAVHPFLRQDKLVALIGGEHSVSIGHVRAAVEYHPDLSVLYLDAHADLRDQYMSTRWGHASVARRISELCPLVQVGVRSLSIEERDFIGKGGVNTFFWSPIYKPGMQFGAELGPDRGIPALDGRSRIPGIVSFLSRSVYVSIDLDVFDPSLMPAVGTPEPGGMDWYEVTSLLKAVAAERHIVGFDVVELCPREGPVACAYTAAKLVYKLVGYATLLGGGRDAFTAKCKPAVGGD